MDTTNGAADLLTVEDESWLLVPAPAWLLDTLAVFGAEAEDREPGLEDEPETDPGGSTSPTGSHAVLTEPSGGNCRCRSRRGGAGSAARHLAAALTGNWPRRG